MDTPPSGFSGSTPPDADSPRDTPGDHAVPSFEFGLAFRGYAPEEVVALVDFGTDALRAGRSGRAPDVAAELRERHSRLPKVLRGFRRDEVDAAVERLCAELERGPSATP
ncbi:hypothetical protein LG943_22305 [Streptomonospora sp. S1-112]|uniref:DivIVA domain-containing protein n=1 Tax=Streptomonospora mangrovi TaxID=2883123 RepID=A0A9X3SFM5_9ACTN|nr:hypothetical protein [Streptomonospora mangrovi]MDA0567028.1 hypothetical protein [Streptomonospora mangrovi]